MWRKEDSVVMKCKMSRDGITAKECDSNPPLQKRNSTLDTRPMQESRERHRVILRGFQALDPPPLSVCVVESALHEST